MVAVETRSIPRDSLFLLADLRFEDGQQASRVKIRNLSNGGLMAEADLQVMRGARVSINLRNIGWVDGNVAWTAGRRFGVAFIEEIDPKLARTAIGDGRNSDTPRFVRPSSIVPAHLQGIDPGKLRKI